MPKIRMPGYPRKGGGRGKGPKKTRSVVANVDAGKVSVQGRDARLPVSTVGVDHVIEVPVANITIQMKGPTVPAAPSAPAGIAFPKVGHYGTGGSVLSYFVQSGWQDHWSKLNFCILGGVPTDGRYSQVSVVKSLATSNGNLHCKFVPYTAPDEWTLSSWQSECAAYFASQTGPGGNAVDWWARSAVDGTIETNAQYGGQKLNVADYNDDNLGPERDAQGRLPMEYVADWFLDNIAYLNTFDGVMLDLFNDRPLTSNADRDGATPYANDTNSAPIHKYAHQRGFQAFVNRWLASRPDDFVVGNNQHGIGYPDGERNLSGQFYEGLVDGMMEYISGLSWSPETNGGFAAVALALNDSSYNAKNGIILVQDIKPRSGLWYSGYTQAQCMRYWLAMCCLCDGAYYCPDAWGITNGRDRPCEFIDEYDLAGTDFSGWLGQALDDPILGDVDQMSSSTLLGRRNWGTYAYKREFENGMVILNPYWISTTSNNNATGLIPAGYKRITGISSSTTYRVADPTWNNGTTYDGTSQVTLQPREALFLVKT